jgi:tRNA A-37 threonylcarbamoyl transferase component Bud32
MNERELFIAVLQQDDPAARAAFLTGACAGDAALRERIEHLLALHNQAGSFLNPPAAAVTATVAPHDAGHGTASFDPPADDAGTVVAGRYKLLQEIGEGGMGSVWMAEQTQPVKRLVALKLIKPGMDSKAVLARFEAERQALALMDHPNIAKVLDGGTTDAGRPYFVMELVKGIPLTQYCDDRQLTVRQRLDLFVQVCSAVQHAHQKGIIHRDLKPSNVLVTEHDGTPMPKVIDFGLAKALHHQHALTAHTLYTAFGTVVGTPLYMAPEQVALNALDVDTRTDIYSLGVLLYELLTGTTPLEKKRFADAAWDEIRRLIREVEPPKPSTRLSTSHTLASIAARRQVEPAKLGKIIRGELDWIVMRALEKDRNRRYSTANAFARDVQRYLADEPVEACPPSTVYRMKKLLRRYKGPVVAAAVVLLTLLGGIVGTAWGLVEARRQRDVAEQERQLAEQERDEREKARQAEEDQRKAAVAARDRAEKERQRADEEAATATTILKFVEDDVFGFGAGEGGTLTGGSARLGANATLREALDAAEPEIGRTFTDRPLVEVRLRNVLAKTYGELGELSLRNQQAQRAYDLGSKKLGTDHPETQRAELALSRMLFDSGRRDEAVRMAEAQLARLNQSPHPDYDLIERTRETLANHYRALGRQQDRLAVYTAMVEDARRRYGPDHPMVDARQVSLAFTLMSLGRTDEAIRLTELALKALTEKEGPDSPQALRAADLLGGYYGKAGRHAEAISLLERTYQAAVRTLGLLHRQTRNMQRALPLEYKAAGRNEDAIRFLEELIPLLRKREGDFGFGVTPELINLASAYGAAGRYQDVVSLLEPAVTAWLGKDQEQVGGNFSLMATNLTNSYNRLGREEDALRLWEQILDGRVRRLGPNHPNTRQALTRLTDLLDRAKQYDRLVLMNRKLLDAQSGAAAADDPERASTLASLGKALLQAGRPAEAEPILRESLAIREKKLPDAWLTFNARSLLGEALARQQKYAEAEPLLVQGYEGLKQRETTIDAASKVRPVEAVGRLIQFYDAIGKPDEATKWQKERDSAAIIYLKSLSNRTDTQLAVLGKQLLDASWAVVAEPVLRQCLTMRDQKQPDDWRAFNARALLGKALADQKRFAEAEPLLLQGYNGLKLLADKVPGDSLVQPADALAWLIQLYDAWGKPDEAAKWRKERDAVQRNSHR